MLGKCMHLPTRNSQVHLDGNQSREKKRKEEEQPQEETQASKLLE
jgi:hypothetical protein